MNQPPPGQQPNQGPGTGAIRRRQSLKLTHVVKSAEDDEVDQRPLDWRLITRLFSYARPHRRLALWLSVMVVLRSLQLPLMGAVLSWVISGPITRGDWEMTKWGTSAFLALALFTVITVHFRQRLALEFGEAIVHDLRNAVFVHLHRLTLGYFTRTKLGRIIGRVTGDVESVRSGVQDVLFVSTVQIGQMLVSAALMIWYDWLLFLVVLALAPVLWGV